MTSLTVAQAATLERILVRLRARGFDPDGLGLDCPNLHVGLDDEPPARAFFWLDGDDGVANGSIAPDGRASWWLRRTYAPQLNLDA